MKGSLVEREELLTLVPHKGKMFLLSRLLSWDTEEKVVSAECDIKENCVFYDASLGGVPGWAGFELMAQTISALMGLIIREKGLPPRYGVILSVSKMNINVLALPLGKTVRIEAREDTEMGIILGYECAIFLDGSLASGAKLTVMDVSDLSVFGE